VRRIWLLAAALALAGCKKDEGAPPPGPGVGGDQSSSLTPAAVKQGMELCEGYVKRLCACAEKDASLAGDCELARGRPAALKMSVHLLSGGEGAISTRERLVAEAGVRKIVGACVSADAQLDPTKCPR
jgi:hypothetical protein